MLRALALLTALALAVPAAAQPALAPEIDARMAAFAAAWSADDADALRALLADDVVLHDRDERSGPDAVMAWAEAQMAATGALTIEPVRSEVTGGQGLQMGRWTLDAFRGAHAFVWRRGADGAWRLAELFIVNDEPAEAAG